MNSLDKFGKFFVRNSRDRIYHKLYTLLNEKAKAPSLQELQNKLSKFSEEEKETIKELVEHLSTGVMHDLLFAFQESSDLDNGIIIQVNDKDVAKESDGLQGEIFLEDGWIKRFSEYDYNAE